MDDEYDWLPVSFDGREWWRQVSADVELVVIADGGDDLAGRWLWLMRRIDEADDPGCDFGCAPSLEEAKLAADRSWENRKKS